MERQSLQTASVYLNNLLLARGLLRNGKSIEFARPDKASGGTEATMAKIINLVHDLVLRRDREAEQREILAGTIRTLRNAEGQHVAELERVQTKCDELRRNLTAAEAQERALKAAARKAESGAKELKDQMQRMKSTLEQVRSKCQSDVRKRDLELEKLKNHLVNLQQRGKRDGTGMNLISIAPHLRDSKPVTDTNNADYSLEQETNAFLASFVKSLNADLDALNGEHRWLLYLIKHTKQELEEMMSSGSEDSSDLGLAMSKQKILPPTCPPTQTYEELAADMNLLLEHCGSILSNPSYVSIEEVEIRENEIIKLREGWEKMAGRLKDALMMMDSWRKRMLDGGETVNIEELGMGMDLGKSMAVHQHGQSDSGVDTGSTSYYEEEEANADPEALFDIEAADEAADEAANELPIEDPEPVQSEEDFSPENSFQESPLALESRSNRHQKFSSNLPSAGKHLLSSPARRGIHIPPLKSALVETHTNVTRPSPAKKQQLSPRKVSFNDDVEPASKARNSSSYAQDEDLDLDEDSIDLDQLLAEEAAKASSVSSASHLSVREKLAIVAAEAEESQVPKKRKRGRASRRRSTLAPEELEELMGI